MRGRLARALRGVPADSGGLRPPIHSDGESLSSGHAALRRVSPDQPHGAPDRRGRVGARRHAQHDQVPGLGRDPRFCLHTATVDPYVGDGDAKLWGHAKNVQHEGLHERFAAELVEGGGPDVRGQRIDPFYVGDITGASCLEVVDGQLRLTIWKPGEGERVVGLA